MITNSIVCETRFNEYKTKNKIWCYMWISILYIFNQLIDIVFKNMKGILTLIPYSNKLLKYPILYNTGVGNLRHACQEWHVERFSMAR